MKRVTVLVFSTVLPTLCLIGCYTGTVPEGPDGSTEQIAQEVGFDDPSLTARGCATTRRAQPGLVIQAADRRTPHDIAARSSICMLNGDPTWAHNAIDAAGCNDPSGHPVAHRCIYLYSATSPNPVAFDHAWQNRVMDLAADAYAYYGVPCFHLDDVDPWNHHANLETFRTNLRELITRMHAHVPRWEISANLASCAYPPTGNANTEFDYAYLERTGDAGSWGNPQAMSVVWNTAFVSCAATPTIHPGFRQAWASMGVVESGRGIAIHGHNVVTSSGNDWMVALASAAGAHYILAGPRLADHVDASCGGLWPCWAYGADFPTDLGSCTDGCFMGSSRYLALCDHGSLLYNDSPSPWDYGGRHVERYDGLLVRMDPPPPSMPPPALPCGGDHTIGNACLIPNGSTFCSGRVACIAGSLVCNPDAPCPAVMPPPLAVCANGDRRPCYTGPPGTESFAPCHNGYATCRSGAWSACEGQVLPVPEVCGNNVDDNCDGLRDYGCPPPPPSCTPRMETCNNADDDCDGTRDNHIADQTCGVGACRRTAPGCLGGSIPACIPGAPMPEICDNTIDENCDGIAQTCPTPPPPSRPRILIRSTSFLSSPPNQGYWYVHADGRPVPGSGGGSWPGDLGCVTSGPDLSCLPAIPPPAGAAWITFNGRPNGEARWLTDSGALTRTIQLTDGRPCSYHPTWPGGTPNVICPVP